MHRCSLPNIWQFLLCLLACYYVWWFDLLVIDCLHCKKSEDREWAMWIPIFLVGMHWKVYVPYVELKSLTYEINVINAPSMQLLEIPIMRVFKWSLDLLLSLSQNSSGGWRSKIKVSPGFFWGLSVACGWSFSPCVLTWSSLCVCAPISSS